MYFLHIFFVHLLLNHLCRSGQEFIRANVGGRGVMIQYIIYVPHFPFYFLWVQNSLFHFNKQLLRSRLLPMQAKSMQYRGLPDKKMKKRT